MQRTPLSAEEANAINLDSEQDVELLKRLVLYWQDKAVELSSKIKTLEPKPTDEDRKRFSGQ